MGRIESTDGRRARVYRSRREHATVAAMMEHHPPNPQGLLPVLREVQNKAGHVSRDALGAVADALETHDARVCGVAEFYSMLSPRSRPANVVRVCDGPVCMLAGAKSIRELLQKNQEKESSLRQRPRWCIERTSCPGLCDRAPAALVKLEACGPLTPQRCSQIVDSDGWRGRAADYREPIGGEVRIALAETSSADEPAEGTRTLRRGDQAAYAALSAALESTPQQILQEVERSGLQGCGGAGFPTGRKWRMAAEADGGPKYVICNADESEPGAFKDRVLLENHPQRLLEGMALAAYAVGANQGIIYVRGEYEAAAKILEAAIREARAVGCLGKRILNTVFSFDVHLHRGAGAYICGEETALLESLEGRRGEPRVRPPYPTTAGYLGKPTLMNNVETLCKIPAIVHCGGDWFRDSGTLESPGTKVFSVSGHVRRPGVFEVPYGRTLRDIIDGLCLGMRTGGRFKMALTGGAAGTIVPRGLLDVPLDFASQQKGVEVGSGAIVVADESVSAVDLLEWLLHFFRVESCGKCTPCRQGTVVAHEVVRRIAAGDGRAGDVATLEYMAKMLRATSLCGLGQSVAWPIESGLAHFSEDFAGLGAT